MKMNIVRYQLILLLYMSVFFTTVIISDAGTMDEITVDSAISRASEFAKKKGYDVLETDIEVLKVKNKFERGPIRLVWLLKNFTMEKQEIIFQNDFWIIYFYPKGLLEEVQLGGAVCVLVELYTGKILDSLEFQ